MTPESLVDRARGLVRPGHRTVLGLTGCPGSGKSTLAATLAEALAPDAVVVPMDGFHLAHSELLRLGLHSRKGAPDTFDAAGYVAILRRLRDPGEDVVYAPEFHRDLEEPVAAAIPVPRDVPLVITEGNYLLLDDGPFAAVRGLLDEVWYLEPDEALRVERLIARHVAFGKEEDTARAWTLGSDQANARLIATTRERADLIVRGTDVVTGFSLLDPSRVEWNSDR